MFIDYTEVELQAGRGGAGRVSFRREKYIPKGGPDGGDGGRGGHIIFYVDPHLHTLQDLRYKRRYRAPDGQPGGTNQKTGRNGADLRIGVPVGTVIKRADTNEVVADLVTPGEEYIVCRGGTGGKGNAHYKSPTRQAPRRAQPGKAGEKGLFTLELKVLADVGLVGLPNAGKSTLLAKISSARPKIADYPFTTLQPHLGIVKYGDYQSFVMADIPGLIEGASQGKGLGLQFLRHVERNRLLLFLIELFDEHPAQTLEILRTELAQYNRDLQRKSFFVVRTKCDLKTTGDDWKAAWENFPTPYHDISSITGQGLSELIKKITQHLAWAGLDEGTI
jgi:GTP-binding protein